MAAVRQGGTLGCEDAEQWGPKGVQVSCRYPFHSQDLGGQGQVQGGLLGTRGGAPWRRVGHVGSLACWGRGWELGAKWPCCADSSLLHRKESLYK